MDLDEFTAANAPKDGGDDFQKENSKLLDITVDDNVMVKAGSMVAYAGDLTFTGKSSAEGGITGMVKKAVSSEGTPIMEAENSRHFYVAERKKGAGTLAGRRRRDLGQRQRYSRLRITGRLRDQNHRRPFGGRGVWYCTIDDLRAATALSELVDRAET